MQVSIFKSVLETTKEFAVWPTPVNWHVPHFISQATLDSRRNGRACPLGVPKATVIEGSAAYTEMQKVGPCGDKEYAIQRRNGTLVEFEFDSLNQDGDGEEALVLGPRLRYGIKNGELYYDRDIKVDHTQLAKVGDKTIVRMIVSRKAIIAPWGEYSLVAEQIKKARESSKERSVRILTAQAQLMGIDPALWIKERMRWNTADKDKTLIRKWEAKFGHLDAGYFSLYKDENGEPIPDSELKDVGKIQITLDQAEKIWNMLTLKQKRQLAND